MDRAQLDLLAAEMGLHLSGIIDDDTMLRLGGILGVHFIITGSFEPFLANHLMTTRVIEVETAAIRGVFTANVLGDATVAFLLGGTAVIPRPQLGFTTAERFATFGLNGLLPGLGSFIIMEDRFGGRFQAIVGGTGLVLTVSGIIITLNAPPENPGAGAGVLVAGYLMSMTSGVFNIVRSARFGRVGASTPQTASIVNPWAWDIAIMPGTNGGLERVSITYTWHR